MASKKQTINVNPEFGVELALAVPYAYWLHKNDQLEQVITSHGMKPFYYFCDNVLETYTHRTIDNDAAGLNTLPNNWIHHNAIGITGKNYNELTAKEQEQVNGTLDYSKWTPPPYTNHYKNDSMKFDKPFVVVANKYTIEHGELPTGYFNLDCLQRIFEYFKSIGYYVVYKRPTNLEFPIDQNDINAINMKLNLKDSINGQNITDFELASYYNNVILFDDIMHENLGSTQTAPSVYNEIQLNLFTNSEGFITPSGGGSILCSLFGKKVLIYATHSGELRPGYFDNDSYYKKLSNSDLHVVYDSYIKIKERGYNDYHELLNQMENIWQ